MKFKFRWYIKGASKPLLPLVFYFPVDLLSFSPGVYLLLRRRLSGSPVNSAIGLDPGFVLTQKVG